MPTDVEARYLDAFDRYTEAAVDTFSAFDKAGFDRPRAEGKWSPGQAVEHLLRVEKGILRLFGAPAERRAGRAADAKCAQLDAELRDGLDPIVTQAAYDPPPAHRNRVDLLDAFVDQRADVRVAAEFSDDFAAVVTAYAHPIFGELTVCEWLYFVAAHGERHRRQHG